MSGINTNYEFNASIQKLYGENSLLNSPWVSHWKVANKIYQDNKLTGVGLKILEFCHVIMKSIKL